MSLEVSIRTVGEIHVAAARGRIVLGEGTDHLHRELRGLIDAGWRKILINLAEVQQIDSTGISTIVRNCTALSRAGGTLKLVCPPGRVRDSLNLIRIADAIPTFDDEASALASFG